jgi:hypothetical protein
MRVRRIAIVLLAMPVLAFSSYSSNTAEGTQIGIIQYNVKGGQGGWTTVNGVLDKQVQLIANQIKTNGVDFITLEQASEKPGSPDPFSISHRLDKQGLTGWNTIVSVCNKDVTQLSFSSDWRLVEVPKKGNPLLNAAFPQRGWKAGGCEPGSDGRPYNIVYLQNKAMLKVLLVIVHMPHCHENAAICTSHWNLDRFHEDITMVVGTSNTSSINLIVAGDMNELGDRGDPNIFDLIFPNFNKLHLSNPLHSCL